MSAYRDDREALREQLEDLRREVATLRGKEPRAREDARLGAMAARVERALDQVTRDREVLRELADGIAALRTGPEGGPGAPRGSAARARRAPRVWLLPVGAALGLGAFFVLRVPARAPLPAPPTPVHADYAGAPHAVEPLDFFDRAAGLAQGKELAEIRLEYVAPGGTVDLDAPEHKGALHFRFALAAPAGAVTATLVDVTSSGLYVSNEPSAAPAFNQPAAKPACTTARVWAAARDAGAPAEGLATLTYHRRVSETRPVWEFEIEGTRHSYVIGDPECRALTPEEMRAR